MLLQKTHWDMDADVAVIGYGCAGAVAAISASDAGARVLVLEKQGSPTPLSTSFMSTAVILSPLDVDGMKRYMEALGRVDGGLSWTDPDVIDAFVRHSSQNKQWFESLGATLELRRSEGSEYRLPGSESVQSLIIKGWGPAMMQLFYDRAKKRGVSVKSGCAATRLITNPRGEVIGVRAKEQEGGEVNVQVRRGVILATGGFEFDEQMKLHYLPIYPTFFHGSHSANGDGVRLALDVGAELWHMNCVAAAFGLKFPELPISMTVDFDGHPLPSAGALAATTLRDIRGAKTHGGYLVVDRRGQRFTNENFAKHAKHGLYYELTAFDTIAMNRPRVPSYWIFDQNRMDAGPLIGGASLRLSKQAVGLPVLKNAGVYTWSQDNSEELERGWIERADTVTELAGKLGLSCLADSVASYNSFCQQGKDPECGREPGTLISLSSPPYYAVKVWPSGPNTQGGPRRNSRGQVLSVNGGPIPRLYSAGELGSIFGMLYPGGGGNLAECVAFGRIAGGNAAEQSPW